MTFRPFSEVARFEQDNSSDPFYASGSNASIGEEPGTFSNSLLSKEQFRISFSVDNSVEMLPNSSSIYYFNIGSKQWNIPTRSIDDHRGPFETFSWNTYWPLPSGTISPFYTIGSKITEDAKLFNCYGYTCASGSSNVYRQSERLYVQTLDAIDSAWIDSTDSITNILNRSISLCSDLYPKSIQRSNIYTPLDAETFEIPISSQFLIEKVVVEVPMRMGTNWFLDRTLTTPCRYGGSMYDNKKITGRGGNGVSSLYDMGGPAVTVSLMCKKKFGITNVLDVISSGTITHSDDANWHLDFKAGRIDDSYEEFTIIHPCGLKSPESVVCKNDAGTFDGKVEVKMTPAVSNGTSALVHYYARSSTVAGLRSLVSPKYIDNSIVGIDNVTIDSFGRCASGFEPSGGSIFGGEFATFQRSSTDNFPNPYYIEDDAERERTVTRYEEVVDPTGQLRRLCAVANSSLHGGKQSPYLVSPGDKLVLAISKTRPAVSSVIYNISTAADCDVGKGQLLSYTQATGSANNGHDVTLTTGTLSMTFYGSYVREGKRYIP